MHTMSNKKDGQTRQRIKNLRREGNSYREIEEKTGASQPTIARVLSEAGMTGDNAPIKAQGNPSTDTPSDEDKDAPSSTGGNGVDEFMPQAESGPREGSPSDGDDNGDPDGGDHGDLHELTEEPLKCGTCGVEFEVEKEDLPEIREKGRLDCPWQECDESWEVEDS